MVNDDVKIINVKTVDTPIFYKNVTKKDKPKRNPFLDWLKQRTKEFCSVTALHGYGHIIREDTALWERIVWGVIVFSASISALILLWFSWSWNAETPTVTVIESTHYATWNIPFPAVTICNANRISASAALRLASTMQRPNNMTAEELSRKFRLYIYYEHLSSTVDENELIELSNILKYNKIPIDKLVKDLTPTCDDMLDRCMWKGTQTRCDVLFQTIDTTDGLCCSFNYYGLEKNVFSTKVSYNIPKLPRRVTSCGYETGLSVLMKPSIRDYHTTVLSSYGFKVMIHNAYDYADDNAEVKLVASKLEAFISISPESTYSTDDVYSLPIKERNCLAEDEMKLGVFQKYSYVNCLAECRSNVVWKICGCIPFNLPNNGSRPVCGISNLLCVQKNRVWFEGSLPGQNYSTTTLNVLTEFPCGCYPDCQLFQYPAEISSGELNRMFSFNSIGFFKDIELDDHTALHVFFKDLVSTHYRNDMYQNWLGVLASFGGLLGLFLGFSLVTGFELIYFFTLRVLFDKIAPKKVSST